MVHRTEDYGLLVACFSDTKSSDMHRDMMTCGVCVLESSKIAAKVDAVFVS